MEQQPAQTGGASGDGTPPAPEQLQAQTGGSSGLEKAVANAAVANDARSTRRRVYKPGHKGIFIGLAIVFTILALNAGVFWYLANFTSSTKPINTEAVTLSTQSLNSLGVARNNVGSSGTELTIGPKTLFNSKVTISNDLAVTGQLALSKSFTAPEGSFQKLQAGEVSFNSLTLNNDITANSFNARKDLNIVGASRLQGPVTISQLLTVNNNVNIAGSLSIGGTLQTRGFQADSLTSGSTLTIGGHIITRGSAPTIGSGSAVGSNGTVSISGSDAAGTIVVNVDLNGSAGTLAQVAFRNAFQTAPHVVFSPVGRSASSVYINRSANGFTLLTAAPLGAGSYIFDYIIMQ